jgi:hypothetical protein
MTGLNVRAWLEKSAIPDRARSYEAVTCPVCGRMHPVNRATGKTQGDKEKRIAAIHRKSKGRSNIISTPPCSPHLPVGRKVAEICRRADRPCEFSRIMLWLIRADHARPKGIAGCEQVQYAHG